LVTIPVDSDEAARVDWNYLASPIAFGFREYTFGARSGRQYWRFHWQTGQIHIGKQYTCGIWRSRKKTKSSPICKPRRRCARQDEGLALKAAGKSLQSGKYWQI